MSDTAAYLVQTLVTLVAVTAVAALVVGGARRLGLGGRTGPMELVGRLPLDARRVVYLVRVGSQVLVVGGSEAGLVKLGELPGDEIPRTTPEAASFANVLARLGRKDEAGSAPRTGPEAKGP